VTRLEITGLMKEGGPLTKRIMLTTDGSLKSDGSACVMAEGQARRATFDNLETFAAYIAGLNPNEAIALGALCDNLPDLVEIVTKDRLEGLKQGRIVSATLSLNGSVRPEVIARTGDHISYKPDQIALALIDVDTKGMPASVKNKIDAIGGFWAALVSVLPELGLVSRVTRRSTSAGIFRTDTMETLPGSNGLHVFILVTDGADIERFLRTLHARCWLHGFGWMMVGAGGQLLDRSIVDRMVYAPERLVFEGAPILESRLAQDQASRAPVVTMGAPIDTRSVCLDLSIVEAARLRALRAAESHRRASDVAKVRATFIEQQVERIVQRTGCTMATARRTVERQCGGVLLPVVVLPFDDAEHTGATVGDVLANPDRFIGATLADPLEGVEYGTCKAKVMRRADGTVWINSFAHGRTTYELKHDAASVEAAMRGADSAETANVFVRMVLLADINPDEEQRLRDLACELSGTTPRPLNARIKAARQQQEQQRAHARREQRTAQPRDRRLRLDAPDPDAERLPVILAVDEVLAGVTDAEPPMRDAEGRPVDVLCRTPIMLHEMLHANPNEGDSDETDPTARARDAAPDAA
jgi:hypothetical protein